MFLNLSEIIHIIINNTIQYIPVRTRYDGFTSDILSALDL